MPRNVDAGEEMAKVRRDDIRQRNVAKEEPRSKLKYLWALLGWGPWAYGVLVLLGQGITFWMDFSDKILPRITADAKADPVNLPAVEFTFKNEGRFTLWDVVLDTVLIWHEAEDGGLVLPYAQDEHTPEERVPLKDRYSFLGRIPRHGGTATYKCLRTYQPLLENIMRVRLALGENETVIPLGLTENVLGLRLLRTFGDAFSA
jgi:hypothetical protein